ncbi:MAG: stage II sporulation protein M [Actinobacteria bacterium]|nr:stage II sporulation protein M [Actinomycetota bacterium]MBI3687832.1 stage II sporulation protein M [Actinomycetota bacterium]
MDIDAFVAAHLAEWQRLEELVRRRRLSGAEADEMVGLYQRAATHLSVVGTRFPDPALVGWLSSLVARGRSAVVGAPVASWQSVARFVTETFPVGVYRAWRWWVAVAAGFLLVSAGLMLFLARHPEALARMATPQQLRQLTEHDFADYYSAHPAQSFAAQVWTNNAVVAAGTLVLGITVLGGLWVLLGNAVNVGVVGGVMIGSGHGALFFGLLSPHGLLELTAVFVAAGAGLQLGWSWIDPGPLPRAQSLAEAGRVAVTVAVGLVGVLAVSGVIEAFVTPSGLPTVVRVGIGVVAEVAFLGYVLLLGRRAVRAGVTGDLGPGLAGDVAPVI